MRYSEGADLDTSSAGNGRGDQDACTHGSSEQRWFTTAYETGDPRRCDTVDTVDTVDTDDLG